MPELQFDENGMPIWTNNPVGPDRSGTDPDPVSEAIAAVTSIGQPGGIPLPGNMQPGPGAQPVGAPPSSAPENALIDPADDSPQFAPGPAPLAPPQPQRPYDPSRVVSGPSEAYAAAQQPPAIEDEPGYIEMEPDPVGRPAKPAKLDSVAAANAQVDATQAGAAQAAYDHGVAVNEAARQLAERRAAAQEGYAAQQMQADQQFQANRAAAQAQSEQETAQWMADMERKAKEEPNPKRWFASQSTASKALWLLSLAFGTKAAATAPGVQNIGLAMIKDQLDQDMGEQKARLAREMEVMRTKGQRLDKKAADRMAFLKDDYSIRTGQLLALEKAALERANAPGAPDDQAAMAQAHSWLAQQRMATAASRAQQAFTAREAQIQRGHSAWMQRNAQQFQAEQNAIAAAERAAKDALDRTFQAADKANAAAAKAASAKAGTFTLDPKSGVRLVVGGKAQPVSFNVATEAGQKRADQVATLSNAAQEVSAELSMIRDAIKDGTFMERILGSDANLQAAVTRLGYSKAKENDPRGIVTNADFAAGVVSAMGVKYDSASGRFLAEAKWGALGKDPSTELAKAIDKELAIVESRTNAKLNTYIPLEDRQGGEVAWRAENRNPAEEQTETLDQATARITGKTSDKDGWIPDPDEIDAITSVKQLEEAQKAARAGATDALPKYRRSADGASNEKVVAAAGNDLKGVSPELVRERAAGHLKRVEGDSRATWEIKQLEEKLVKDAEKREEQVRTALTALTFKKGPVTQEDVAEELRKKDLERMREDAAYVKEVMDAVNAVSPMAKVPNYKAKK